ncbi:MAG: hypothetical protein AMXMBFR47_08940 [Planctomycetota bacterium]
MLRRPRLKWRIALAVLGATLFIAVGLLPTNAAFPRLVSIGGMLNVYRICDCYLITTRPRADERLWDNYPPPFWLHPLDADESRSFFYGYAGNRGFGFQFTKRPGWLGVETVPWKGSFALLVEPRRFRWLLLGLFAPLLFALNRIRLRARRWQHRVCMACAYSVYESPALACPECGSAVPEPSHGDGVSFRLRKPRYLWRILLAGFASIVFVGLSLLPPGIGGSLTNFADFHGLSLFVYALDARYVLTTQPRDIGNGIYLDDDPREFELLMFLNGDDWLLVSNPPTRPWFGIEIGPWGRSRALVVEPCVVRWVALVGLLPLLAALATTGLRARRRREQRCRRCGYLGIGDAAECPLCREPTGRRRSGRPRWAGSIVAAIAGAALFVGLSRPGERTHSLGLWARLHDVPLYVFSLKECLIFTTRPRAWDLEPEELKIYREEEAGLVRLIVEDALAMPWFGVQSVPWKGTQAFVVDCSRVRWAAMIFGVPLLVSAIRWAGLRRRSEQMVEIADARR